MNLVRVQLWLNVVNIRWVAATTLSPLYFALVVVHNDERVCLFVCLSVRTYLTNHTSELQIFRACCLCCGCDSVLLWRHCGMQCTSGFVDGVMFSHNGHYGGVTLRHAAASLLCANGSSRKCDIGCVLSYNRRGALRLEESIVQGLPGQSMRCTTALFDFTFSLIIENGWFYNFPFWV